MRNRLHGRPDCPSLRSDNVQERRHRGYVFAAPGQGTVPLYRWFDRRVGSHYYTTSPAARIGRATIAKASPATSSTTPSRERFPFMVGTVEGIIFTQRHAMERASLAEASGRRGSRSLSSPILTPVRFLSTAFSTCAAGYTSTRPTRTRSSRNRPSATCSRDCRASPRISSSGSCSGSDGGGSARRLVTAPSRIRWNSPVSWAGQPGGDVDAAVAEHRLHLGQRGRLLDAADEPGADVVAALVVEVAGALGGQQAGRGRPTGRGAAGSPSAPCVGGCRCAGRYRSASSNRKTAWSRPSERRPAGPAAQRPPGAARPRTGRPGSAPRNLVLMTLSRVLPAGACRPSPSKASGSSGSPRAARNSPAAQPEGLQVLHELVEELEVEPADRVDQAGSFSAM